MTLEQIKMFITAAECLNFTVAANKEFVSQPTLSYGISSLENQLRLKLFVRDKKGVALTPAGVTFYTYAKDYVIGIENAIKATREMDKNSVESLSLGYLISPAEKHFPQWLPAFIAEYPNTRLVVEQYEMTDLKNALFNNTVDLVLSRSLDYIDCENLVEIQPLMTHQMFCCVGKDHPLYGRGCVSIKELRNEKLILPDAERSRSWYHFVLDFCKEHGVEYSGDQIITVKSASAIAPMVSCGIGIAYSTDVWRAKYSESIGYLSFSDAELFYDTALIWRKSNKNPLIKRFVDLAVKSAPTECAGA